MKNCPSILVVVFGAICVWKALAEVASSSETRSGMVNNKPKETLVTEGALRFQKASVQQVLEKYAELSGRKLLSSKNLPEEQITIHNCTPLTREEALRALEVIMLQQGVDLAPEGDKFIVAFRAETGCGLCRRAIIRAIINSHEPPLPAESR